MSNVALHSGLRKDNLVPGITTASVLVVTIVSTIVGGLTGMLLYSVLSPPWLAVVAGAAGAFAAAFVATSYSSTHGTLRVLRTLELPLRW